MVTQWMEQGTYILIIFLKLQNGTIAMHELQSYQYPYECAVMRRIYEQKHPERHYSCLHVQLNEKDQKANDQGRL